MIQPYIKGMARYAPIWVSDKVRDMVNTIKKANGWGSQDITLQRLLEAEYRKVKDTIKTGT